MQDTETKALGAALFLALSSQLPRQLDLGHNGRKQQPLLADSSQHAAKISACLSWKSSEHIPSITSEQQGMVSPWFEESIDIYSLVYSIYIVIPIHVLYV